MRGLVLELVEGETLAERIAVGRSLPIAEVLGLARQIADALDAAHEKGIVHRDLKPANIKITADGVVKVLDFGLAKVSNDTSATDLSASPTLAVSGGTFGGVILGTAAYMSPEQVRGRPVDRRTDIWSFGCLLYECLTGRMAFAGETAGDILAAILAQEPELALLPRGTPAAVQRLVALCLRKDARQRMREMDEFEARSLSGTDGATSPFFSPDGSAIGYFVDRKLKRRSLADGASTTLCGSSAETSGASWEQDNTIIYSPEQGAGLWRIA